MVVLLTVVVAVCFVASLLPFLFPGAALGLLGVVLNDRIGNLLAGVAPGLRQSAVMAGPEGTDLTFQGVLLLYVPLFFLLLLASRRRV